MLIANQILIKNFIQMICPQVLFYCCWFFYFLFKCSSIPFCCFFFVIWRLNSFRKRAPSTTKTRNRFRECAIFVSSSLSVSFCLAFCERLCFLYLAFILRKLYCCEKFTAKERLRYVCLLFCIQTHKTSLAGAGAGIDDVVGGTAVAVAVSTHTIAQALRQHYTVLSNAQELTEKWREYDHHPLTPANKQIHSSSNSSTNTQEICFNIQTSNCCIETKVIAITGECQIIKKNNIYIVTSTSRSTSNKWFLILRNRNLIFCSQNALKNAKRTATFRIFSFIFNVIIFIGYWIEREIEKKNYVVVVVVIVVETLRSIQFLWFKNSLQHSQ